MMKRLLAIILAAAFAAACSPAADSAPEAEPAYTPRQYMQAIGDIARLDDQQYDELRKPGELLAFAQIDQGETVGDFIMGGGYVTRLLAMAVGANGRVFAFQPTEFVAFRAEYGTAQDDAVAPYSDDNGDPVRVFPLRDSILTPGFPEGEMDTIITVMNYHDLWFTEQVPKTAPDITTKALFDALKPGGVLVVVDHLAANGAGADAANTLHRMDRELALATLTSAGFVLEEESDLYTRPDDPRDANVFDPGIQGKTDQFAWRLRKPTS